MPSIRYVSTQLSARFAPDTTSHTPSDVSAGVVRPSRGATLVHRARVLDRLVAETLQPLALPSLRILLGLVFVWFGGLKVAGVSPVRQMVANTLPWAPPHVIVPVLGSVEVLLGVGLITGVALRLVLPVLALHLAGTFLTFVMLPGQMFHASDPLILTESGEFVMKNVILISATLVLIAHTYRPSPVRSPELRAQP
jgi:putative oxidoreductase